MARGASPARQNALRSALVVLGSIAFGYISLQVGFKPYLERAREAAQISESDDPAPESNAAEDLSTNSFPPEEQPRKFKDTVLD